MKVNMEMTALDEILIYSVEVGKGIKPLLSAALYWAAYAKIDMNPLHSMVLCTYGK